MVLLDLASENIGLKNKIALLIAKLDTQGIQDIEDQVCTLMSNMMNFFSQYIQEIPSFDNLSEEQKKYLLLKFKKVAYKLKTKKIKTIDEMLQNFIFTIMQHSDEKTESIDYLTSEEMMYKKRKQDFGEFIRKAGSHQIYKLIEDSIEEEKTNSFIHDAVILGVKKAAKKAGIKLSLEEINQGSLKTLENAHKTYKKAIVKLQVL